MTAGSTATGIDAALAAGGQISGTVTDASTSSPVGNVESHGGWTNSPTSFGYQWEDCDTSGNNCSAITGAISQTYTLTAADVGHTIRVQETASNAGGSSTPATSAQVGPVAAGTSGALSGVAATSATNAWAVGSTGNSTLISHWNGTTWN